MKYLWTVALLSLAACGGGGYCGRLANAAEDCDEVIEDEDIDACEESVADCSGDDMDLLDEYLDCLEDLGFLECDTTGTGTTSTGGTDDFAAMMDCAAPVFAGLSAECLAGMGSTGGTTTTTSTTY